MSFIVSANDEAGFRALEPKCASAHSADSKRTVALLSTQSQAFKDDFLHSSVLWGLSSLVRCALEAGASPSSRLSAAPALAVAAITGHTRIVKQLLEAGADHSLKSSDGFSALIAAAQEGHLDCIKVLLAAGADANMAGPLGITPLLTAIGYKHHECAKALLPASDLSITNCMGQTALHLCAVTANEECFEMLLPHVSDVDVRTVPGVDPEGKLVPYNGCSTLHLACLHGQHRMARALLKRGANRMARDSNQGTPLFCCAVGGHLACVVLLLGQPGRFKMTPAEVNAMNHGHEMGATALHHAVIAGHVKICGVLLEAGARLDSMTSTGLTPLMVAQLLHPTNTALLALLSGAGPAQPPGTVCDHCGKTAAQASVNSLKACSQCQAVRYCSAVCGAAAWRGHKKACKARAAERDEMVKPIQVPM